MGFIGVDVFMFISAFGLCFSCERNPLRFLFDLLLAVYGGMALENARVCESGRGGLGRGAGMREWVVENAGEWRHNRFRGISPIPLSILCQTNIIY